MAAAGRARRPRSDGGPAKLARKRSCSAIQPMMARPQDDATPFCVGALVASTSATTRDSFSVQQVYLMSGFASLSLSCVAAHRYVPFKAKVAQEYEMVPAPYALDQAQVSQKVRVCTNREQSV
eukprot:6183718-Pleurochrysis_carterae.AAC.1